MTTTEPESARRLQRAIDALGLETRDNPARAATAPAKRKLPRGAKVIELPQGTDLWRGTSNPADREDSWQWYTDSASTARAYVEGRGPDPWCVLWFDTKRPLRLVQLADYKALDRMAARMGAEVTGDPRDVAYVFCEAGVDGWFIVDGDHDGADVLVCDPSAMNLLRGVDQSDDWDWSAWPGYG